MKNKANQSLNILIGCIGGQFVGRALAQYVAYRKHPGIFFSYSAPWYTGILLNAAISGVVIGIAVVVKILLKRKMR